MASASLQQRTPAWHAARRGKLTASNIGSALGLCQWTTRQQAYDRAMGVDKFVGNDATRWGVANESNGILAYTAHTGNLVDATGLHVHKSTSWLAGSPDGLVGTSGMIEVKCPYWRKKDGSRLHKEIPAHYYMQINLCLEICEREWCDYICWSPDGYVIYRVTRDPELHDALMPHYLKFFGAMSRMAKTPPVQTAEEKEQIKVVVNASMLSHIDYTAWTRVDTSVPAPDVDDFDYSDTESCEPPAKRQRVVLFPDYGDIGNVAWP